MNDWLEGDSEWLDQTMREILSKPLPNKFWYKGVHYNCDTGEPSWEAIRAVGKELLDRFKKGEQV